MNEIVFRIAESAAYGSCLVFTAGSVPTFAIRVSPEGLFSIDELKIMGVDVCEF